MDIEESQEANLCRICFEEETKDEADLDNKFVSPCSCKGSSKYVHVGCLKNWIKSKKQPNKQSSGQHSLQSSLMNLFRDLLGLSNQQISQPNPAMMSFSLTQLPMTYQAMPNYPARLATPFQYPSSQMIPYDPLYPNHFGMNISMVMQNGDPSIRNNINEIRVSGIPQQMGSQPPTYGPNATDTSIQTKPDVENNWFSNFACDVCKNILPFAVKLNEETEVEMANISKPEDAPYVILERLSQGKGVKVFSVIKGIENSEVRLGRGHSCDIPISDISVSRFHAIIRYQNGKFVIVDNNSKYGTLVKLEDAIELRGEKLGFQSGRTLITISVKPEKSAISNADMIPEIMQVDESILLAEKSKPMIRTRKVNPEKRVHAQIKQTIVKNRGNDVKANSDDSDVEEIPRSQFSDLNSHSKKISKKRV